MQFPPQRPGRPLKPVWRTTVKHLGELITIAWKAHRDLLDQSLVYRTLMIILAQVILAQLDLGYLLQVIHDLLDNLLRQS
jgi:hypothetical protein